jgi:hypothetical protein
MVLITVYYSEREKEGRWSRRREDRRRVKGDGPRGERGCRKERMGERGCVSRMKNGGLKCCRYDKEHRVK